MSKIRWTFPVLCFLYNLFKSLMVANLFMVFSFRTIAEWLLRFNAPLRLILSRPVLVLMNLSFSFPFNIHPQEALVLWVGWVESIKYTWSFSFNFDFISRYFSINSACFIGSAFPGIILGFFVEESHTVKKFSYANDRKSEIISFIDMINYFFSCSFRILF